MRWAFRSTFSQIIWLQMLAIVATSLIMPVAIFLFLSRTMTSYQLKVLHQHEQGLLGALNLSGSAPILPQRLRNRYGADNSGFDFAVVDAVGQSLISSQPGRVALAPLPAPGDKGPRIFKLRLKEGVYSGASFPETVAGRRIWIQIGENLEYPDVVLDDVLARFLPQVGWLSVVLLLVLLAVDVIIVRRALAPVLRASKLAEAITPSRIDVRLPVIGMPQEIAPLFQAVRNLVENAIAHAPSGSAVHIELDAEGVVRVLDRGPGVPADQRELLFRRFWRRRRTSSQAGAGAGLGLSIVSRIAERHQGTVSVEDRPGGGAAFVLRLPLASA